MWVHHITFVFLLIISSYLSFSHKNVAAENAETEADLLGAYEKQFDINPGPDTSVKVELETQEIDGNDAENKTVTNSTIFINCSKIEDPTMQVELVNSSRLITLLAVDANVTRSMAAECLVLMFYARWCPFSAKAAPSFNALARAFPHIKMAAVDAMKYHHFNTQFGVVGVPTFILFHNGRAVLKFNFTNYHLDTFIPYISRFTKIQAEDYVSVGVQDYDGPVPGKMVWGPDYFLWLSWAFLALSAVVFFSKSSWCRLLVEAVQNTWRESEAQHHHMD